MPEMSPENIHLPVLPGETVEFLNAGIGGLFVDATLGLGGHSELILGAANRNLVIAIDQDEEAIELAEKRLEPFAGRVRISHSNFSQIRSVLDGFDIETVDGILADLGV